MKLFDFFPHSTFRKFQKETIQKIQDAFDSGRKYVLLESPTGSGKSAIGITLGLFNESSYILTSQKVLQDQYVNDYECSDVRNLKGKQNYECIRFGGNCKEGCQKIDKCPDKGVCNYEIAKKNAQNAKVALMNYSYFFNVMEYTQSFAPRNLIILDEAHRCDHEILKFIEFSFSSYYLSKLGITSKIPEYETVSEYHLWIEEIHAKILSLKSELAKKLELYRGQLSQDTIKEYEEELENLESLDTKICRFFASYLKTEWIFEITENEKLKSKTITFKPVKVSSFTHSYLFDKAEKVLLLSATVLSKKNMCNNLGIEESECEFIQTESTFPDEKRPIYLTDSGNMGMKFIDESLKQVITDINKILDYHHDERGLIHTHTYKITQYLINNLDRKFEDRLMSHLPEERESKLNEFLLSTENKVLLAPSMTDGVDLKDDLARFIVIVKIPYLYLGDKQVKRRMEIDPDWYSWKAALTLVQAAGRAMRHENDYCTIYIMDSAFEYFLKRNKGYFPKYFINSIKNRR